jgi:hypothetical protein
VGIDHEREPYIRGEEEKRRERKEEKKSNSTMQAGVHQTGVLVCLRRLQH